MISAVVIACQPERVGEVKAEVGSIEWLDVHYEDVSGRLVVTVEAADTAQSIDRLHVLQDLTGVLSVSLAEYYLEGDEAKGGAANAAPAA